LERHGKLQVTENSMGSVQPQCAAKRDGNCGRFFNFQPETDRVIEETNMLGSFFMGMDY
jgi:hypothetical protein